MANKKYVVELTLEEREGLLAKIDKGQVTARARRITRFGKTLRPLLRQSPGRVKYFAMEGLAGVFTRKRRAYPSVQRIFRWRGGSQTDCAGLLRATGELCALEDPAFGREGGRA